MDRRLRPVLGSTSQSSGRPGRKDIGRAGTGCREKESFKGDEMLDGTSPPDKARRSRAWAGLWP